MDIEVGIGTDVLDLVNSRLQLPVPEQGKKVAGRVQVHDWQKETGSCAI